MTRFDQIEHASLTDVGVRRSHNQDNYAIQLASDDDGWRQRGHLFVVADGMGAHAVGEKAAEQAAQTIPHIYQKNAQQGPVPALRKAFVEANAGIHACGQQNREFEGMGTTSTALVLRPDGAWIGHVGDSRCYRIRQGVIEQLSYDHSMVWEYARLQHLDPDEVEDIPHNVIFRCLGPEALVQVDVEGPHAIEPGDIFLLCSDGLSGQVSDPEIGAFASVLPPAEACRFLVDLSNLRGGPDNITVLIVRIGSGPAPPPRPKPSLASQIPWWAGSMAGGTLLAVLAFLLLQMRSSGLAMPFLVVAVAAVLAGLVGFVISYRQEQRRLADEDSNRPPAKAHRRRSCAVEKPIIERLLKALRTLEGIAAEKGWTPDWAVIKEQKAEGDAKLAAGELAGAFRDYCRAMLPLMRTSQERRQKEEVFRPVWDKLK
ncbi:MAG: protein phosphatase 2C domain-containing protein [Gemmataceae bacterium]|nr:protein phosphatase 2C domain-containing protein [Gemmataceae bacterium]